MRDPQLEKISDDLFDIQQLIERFIERSIELDVETSIRRALGQIKAARTTIKGILNA